MKLYTTITNEKRKQEGIGGNESLTIEINRGNRRMIELYLTIDQLNDNKELLVLDMLNLSNGSTTRVNEYEINKSLPEYSTAKKQTAEKCNHLWPAQNKNCSYCQKQLEPYKAKKQKGGLCPSGHKQDDDGRCKCTNPGSD